MTSKRIVIGALLCIAAVGGYLWLNEDVVSGCGHSRTVSTHAVAERMRQNCLMSLQAADALGHIAGCQVSLKKLREQTLFDTYVYSFVEKETFEGRLSPSMNPPEEVFGSRLTVRKGSANVCGVTRVESVKTMVLNSKTI
ncbi:hypothetical protein [Asticcacaulis sp.]|uniref:hypothetical protein n=1 Tax=Asticcacaulis sp. TaxID=1872648 RepID=UPI00391C0D6F